MKSKVILSERPKLFVPREDWWHNACVNYLPDAWDVYAWGYKEGAETLIEEVKRSRHRLDFLIYPIVFLYRQYFELRLKALLREGSQLADNSRDLPTHHKLVALWQDVCKLLKEVFPDEDPTPLDEVERVLVEFEQIDPASTAFRYPIDTKGAGSLPGITHINIVQLQEQLARTIELLEGAACAVSEHLALKHDMEQEYY